MGFPLAYYIARYAQRKTLLLLLVIVPFWTSFLIRTYSWLVILDPDFFLWRALGLGDFEILYTTKAIYIGVVYNYLPLMVLPLYAALERMDWSLVEAAQDLGDSSFRAFRRVTLPLALPGVLAGSLLVFIPRDGRVSRPGDPRRRQDGLRREPDRAAVPRGPGLAVRSGDRDGRRRRR